MWSAGLGDARLAKVPRSTQVTAALNGVYLHHTLSPSNLREFSREGWKDSKIQRSGSTAVQCRLLDVTDRPSHSRAKSCWPPAQDPAHAYQCMQALRHVLLDTHMPTYMHESNCECMRHTRNTHVCTFLRLHVATRRLPCITSI